MGGEIRRGAHGIRAARTGAGERDVCGGCHADACRKIRQDVGADFASPQYTGWCMRDPEVGTCGADRGEHRHIRFFADWRRDGGFTGFGSVCADDRHAWKAGASRNGDDVVKKGKTLGLCPNTPPRESPPWNPVAQEHTLLQGRAEINIEAKKTACEREIMFPDSQAVIVLHSRFVPANAWNAFANQGQGA